MREDISSALNLPKVGEETLKLHTFGSSVPQSITCNKVKLTLSNIRNGQSVQLEVLEIPRVCSSIMRVAGEEVRRELERKGLQLADTSVSGMETWSPYRWRSLMENCDRKIVAPLRVTGDTRQQVCMPPLFADKCSGACLRRGKIHFAPGAY